MSDRLRLSNHAIRLIRKIDSVFLKAAGMFVITNGIASHRGSPPRTSVWGALLEESDPRVPASKLCPFSARDLQKPSGLRKSLSRRTGNCLVIRTV